MQAFEPERLSNPFQSTPLREGRHARGTAAAPLYPFQSTPLREGRRPSPRLG